VGVADDRFNLRGRQKLVGQIIACTVLISFGFEFQFVEVFGVTVNFGIFSVVVVYAWCLAAINSVNLLDGADGFAATIGIIVCLALSVMAFSIGLQPDGYLCLAMAGALIGFLRYNFPPAKAYLGDAGSMLIGLFFAAITIRCGFKQSVAYAVFAPLALLAIPLLDTSAAIIRRRFTGRSIYTEDRGHLHHVLAKKGLSPVKSLMWVAALCSMTAAGGTISLIMHQAEYALASIIMVLIVMVAGQIFGVAEFRLLSRRFVEVLKGFMMFPARRSGLGIHESAIQLQGSRDWQEVWSRLSEFAQDHELNQIMLDVNAPWLHEGFHGVWSRKKANTSGNQQWQAELPMVVDGRILGKIKAYAPRDCRFSHHDIVINLLKVVQDIELLLEEIHEASHEIPIDQFEAAEPLPIEADIHESINSPR
jgi:UDP-GlcNAc:undecaprenyl-phosphate GlcNAc-1-phosphate transferase